MRFSWLLVICLLPMGARAATWTETGDAPELPAGQATQGAGPLDTIEGTFADGRDADLYRIRLDDPPRFSAALSTPSDPGADTQIFLFDAAGLGIAGNDDPNSQTLHGAFVAGDPLTADLTPGIYLLGVSQFDIVPLAGGLRIFPVDLFDEALGPEGPGGPGPVDAWGGDDLGISAGYRVSLTGASFAVPEPASAGALLGALAALFLAARSRLGRRADPPA